MNFFRRAELWRFLALVALIALRSASAALAEGWIPAGPTGVGMVTSLSAGSTAIYAATCDGVYRSVDGGSSWHEAGLQGECVVQLAADPRSDALYAILRSHNYVPQLPEPSFLTFGGSVGSPLWVSNDGGQSWTQTPLLNVTAVAVDPTAPATAYAAALGSDLWSTADSGASWSSLPQFHAGGVAQLTVDPRDGAIYGTGGGTAVFVIAGGDLKLIPFDFFVDAVGAGSGPGGAVYAAGFEHFCRRTTAAPDWACSAFPGSKQASILELPATGSEASRILVAGYDGVWFSNDGGTSWSLSAGDPGGYTPALALDPSGSAVYAGNDFGVYRSADRGSAWTKASGGLHSTWVRALALDPTDLSTVWVGAEGRVSDSDRGGPGLFRSTDAGGSWTSVAAAGETVTAVAVDPSNPLACYAGVPGAIIRTEDGGRSWSRSDIDASFVFGLATDPASSRVWAAGDRGLRTSVGGQTWSSSAVTQSIFCLLFDSRHPGTIYAGAAETDGGSYYPFGFGGSIFASRDGGDTWTRTNEDLGSAVLSLAIDPFSDKAVYAGTDGGTILRSPDAGVTWERWDTQYPGRSVLALVADPVRPGRLYAGGWSGVFQSVDGGRNWHSFSDGLSPLAALGLAISPDGRWLYAGTDGGGLYRRDLTVVLADRPPVTTIDRPRAPRTLEPRPP